MARRSKPKTRQKRYDGKKPSIGVKTSEINYKNAIVLKKFLSSRFKILPLKATGLNAKNQRKLKTEIKKARIMGLLPFTDRHSLG